MAATDKTNRREEAAEYWAANEVTAENSSEVSEDVLVRKPLSAMLTLRLSDEDLSKLKLVAAAQGVGVTTMARMLLHQCLTNPGLQLTRQVLQSREIEQGLAQVLKDAEIPQGDCDTEFLVLSKAHLERINMTLTQAVAGLLFDDLMEQSISVTASQGEVFDRLRELSPTS
jgi:predicted DNA binding CopG/RHH family protein